MANLIAALDVLKSWEGGYAKVKRDPGGETYCGISRINFPQWDGWDYIDTYKETNTIKWNAIIPSVELETSVDSFYDNNFWSNQDYKDIENQDVASKIFQHNVNLGQRGAMLAQQAINFNTPEAVDTIATDSRLGHITVSALNKLDKDKFLTTYCGAVQSYYMSLIREHPQLHIFQNEWFLRANTIGKRPT